MPPFWLPRLVRTFSIFSVLDVLSMMCAFHERLLLMVIPRVLQCLILPFLWKSNLDSLLGSHWSSSSCAVVLSTWSTFLTNRSWFLVLKLLIMRGGSQEADVQIFKRITDPHGGPDLCPPLPVLVVEVGVSETYVELIRDARHWLEQTQGEVRAVVLIKVFEKQDYKEKHMAGCSKDVLDAANDDRDSSDDSTGSSYTGRLNYFRTHPDLVVAYAGTLSGFVEVWRYSATTREM
ncbi:hypothetical protein BGX38DRAFT_61313 [Terfezia claveryi]|nr:hypothetical protein BGX38DRAFT_61313 [Terfezia claveryi]